MVIKNRFNDVERLHYMLGYRAAIIDALKAVNKEKYFIGPDEFKELLNELLQPYKERDGRVVQGSETQHNTNGVF